MIEFFSCRLNRCGPRSLLKEFLGNGNNRIAAGYKDAEASPETTASSVRLLREAMERAKTNSRVPDHNLVKKLDQCRPRPLQPGSACVLGFRTKHVWFGGQPPDYRSSVLES